MDKAEFLLKLLLLGFECKNDGYYLDNNIVTFEYLKTGTQVVRLKVGAANNYYAETHIISINRNLEPFFDSMLAVITHGENNEHVERKLS
jgi:hypothetical protein